MSKTEYDDIKANLIKKSLEQNAGEVVIPPERRKSEDKVLHFINYMSVLLWLGLVGTFILIIKSGGNITNIVENNLLFMDLSFWKIKLLKISLIMTAMCVCIGIIGIVLNFSRHKRRSDRIKRSLIIGEILSFCIGIFLVIKLF